MASGQVQPSVVLLTTTYISRARTVSQGLHMASTKHFHSNSLLEHNHKTAPEHLLQLVKQQYCSTILVNKNLAFPLHIFFFLPKHPCVWGLTLDRHTVVKLEEKAFPRSVPSFQWSSLCGNSAASYAYQKKVAPDYNTLVYLLLMR